MQRGLKDWEKRLGKREALVEEKEKGAMDKEAAVAAKEQQVWWSC